MRPGGQHCGCFTGRYVDGDEEPVAIRCPLHVRVPAPAGVPVRRLDEVRVGRLLPLPPSRVHARVRLRTNERSPSPRHPRRRR